MVSKKIEKYPGNAAKFTRQELLDTSARTAALVKKDGLHLKIARELPRRRIHLQLDDARDDALLDHSLKAYWPGTAKRLIRNPRPRNPGNQEKSDFQKNLDFIV